jgi:hypothetical protein
MTGEDNPMIDAAFGAMQEANRRRGGHLIVAVICAVFRADGFNCQPRSPCGGIVGRHLRAHQADTPLAALITNVICAVYAECGHGHDPAAVRAAVGQALADQGTT